MKAAGNIARQLYDFVDYLQVEKNASLHTVNTYRADMECFIAFARLHGAASEALFFDADTMLIRAYIASLTNAGYAVHTVLRRISVLKTFFRFLSKVYGIENYPFTGIHISAAPKAVPAILSVDEMTRLLNMPSSDYLGVRDRAILELLYACGLKVGELVSLTVKDIDLDVKMVLLYGKRARVLPLGRHATNAIAYYLEFSRPHLCSGKSHESLFVNSTGSPLSERSVRRIVNKYACALGKKLSPQAFRYIMSAHLLDGNANIQVVGEILGQLDVPPNELNIALSGERLKTVYKVTHPRA